MTTPRRGRGLLAVTAVSATTVLAITATGALAAPSAKPGPDSSKQAGQSADKKTAKERKGNYDARTPSDRVDYANAARTMSKQGAAQDKFRASLGSQAVVSVDQVTGTPKQVAKLNGFLTGASNKPAAKVALDYIRAHPEIFHLSEQDLQTLRLRKDYKDIVGTHHVSWEQVVGGVPLFGNGLQANVTKKGQLISIQGSPVAGLNGLAASRSAGPAVSADSARGKAASDVDGKAQAVKGTAKGNVKNWTNGDQAKLVWFYTADGLRKGWATYTQAGDSLNYTHVIDAQSGAVLYRRDLTDEANGDALVQENYPGAPRGGQQHVVNLFQRGFLLKGATTLDGTSVHAFADVNDDNVANAGENVKVPGTKHGAEYVLKSFNTNNSSKLCSTAFICTWDPAKPDSWKVNQKQDVTNAFYLASNFHDWLQKGPIGFTPAAGNFTTAGGDPVSLNALDGAATAANGGPDANHLDNANMNTPPDGLSPTMQMYLWHTPGADDTQDAFVPSSGANDASILYHEYTHGLSNRLVVDASGNSTLNSIQAGSMGEAWSDFYAMDYLVTNRLEKDTSKDGEVLEGKYVSAGALFRTQAMDCSVGSASPNCVGIDGSQGGYTYGDFPTIGGAPEVHSSGEVWAQTLWDIRKKLGRTKALSDITRGMELSPADPSMLDMRNAILQADLVAFGGANQKALWKIFANRGMGWFAGATNAGDSLPAEDTHVPPTGATATLSGTVIDKDTNTGVSGALVFIAGHDSGFGGDYTAVTNAQGKYTIPGIFPGTYPKFVVAAKGYEILNQSVTVSASGTTANFSPRRNWASASGGGTVKAFNGPDFSPQCGPGFAIDSGQGTGWGSTTGDNAGNPTNVMIPKNIDIALPAAVNVTKFSVDPSNTCGDPGSASTGDYRIETSVDGTTWATAQTGTFTAANRGKYTELTPSGNATGIKFVRFVMLSPQVPNFSTNCPAGAFGGCKFTDMSEIQVFGTK
ncbi:peptidase M36 [Kribbella qitaiheensis]|uniref:Peptidase M36 n=1 Tax=Kribbella qitaiheensis TaxID=1544730 RepID=A0A7G6X041_9ACTN|nr:M36 family metallopeptidase [Kribbella qitaiheensis]QNE19606.1 peptidase M36 [Kribbella qitaiheensis]